MRMWKLIGLAGIVGVVAAGTTVGVRRMQRARRRFDELPTDELGRRLRERLAAANVEQGALTIRPYRPDDLDAVHACNQAEVPAVGDASPEHLAHIAAESTIALVAEADGHLAGFCLVLGPGADYGSVNYRWFAERYADFVYLDRVAIAPAFQRRGIGRRLYAEVERLAAERRPDATHFALEVNLRPRNDTSLAFHADLGFAEVGQQETDYGALVSMMTKPLD